MAAAAAAFAKVISVATALVSIPLTLHYLGAERFGLWVTISSLIAMLAFADFGIANGVLSVVADANGRDDKVEIQRTVSSSFFMLGAVSLAILALFALVYPLISWEGVFNVKTPLAAAESGPAFAVFAVSFALAIPVAVVQRVQMGLQLGFIASLWQCLGSLFALAGVLIVISLQLGLPWLVAALAGAPLIAALLNSLHFYFFSRPDLRPKWANVSRASARRVANSGVLFFVLQMTVTVAYSSDSIVIAQVLGAAAVAEFSVPERLFSLIPMALMMVLSPLWPAYGEAIARGDAEWIRNTLKRSLLLAAIVGGSCSLALFFLAPAILKYWVGDAVNPPVMLLAAFALWKTIEAMGSAIAMYLNGAHIIKLQVIIAGLTAVAALSLKLLLVPAIGVDGAVWATVIAYVLFAGIPFCVYLPKLLKRQALPVP